MAGLNIELLKREQERLEAEVQEEYRNSLKKEILEFVNSDLFRESLNTKSRKEVRESSRVINHWEEKGLIDKTKDEKGKWRKYNRIESIWLTIISELREFGFPLEKIKLIKKSLWASKIKNFRPIEHAIMYSVLRQPMLLVVYLDGRIGLFPKVSYSQQIASKAIASHICFDFQYLVSQEFPNNNFDEIAHSGNGTLTEKELALLYYLRTGDFKTLKVILKGGDIYLLEGERSIPVNSKIADVLANRSYQSIEVMTEAGKVVSFKTKEKIKLKQ